MTEYIDLPAAMAFVEANYQGRREKMARLIDADGCPCIKCDRLGNCRPGLCEAFAEWWLSPVDAVEVVHGYWRYYSTTMQECSYCKRHTARHKYKYCPHCGAVMEDKYNDG